jgi:hypothetical protein
LIRWEASIAVLLVTLFLIGACFAANQVFGGGHGGKHGRFGHEALFRLPHKLNLTEKQIEV